MQRIEVKLKEKGYPILVGTDLLTSLPLFTEKLSSSSRHILVSDPTVYDLYGSQTLKILRGSGFELESAILPGGEENKNLAAMMQLYEQMLDYGLDRSSCVLALGGGIVGDMAGFAAATYMRGISYIQIPTTLLAQVDSSIGGKTGVNLPIGKNLVGAFHQPLFVLSDLSFLNTLSEKDYCNGLAEVIKYGLLADDLWQYLEDKQELILQRDAEALLPVIRRCSEIKAEIVSEDEHEHGKRALLNLGHTFGHAFETLTAYQQYTHGEAVAMGMVYAAKTACLMGMISEMDSERIKSLIAAYKLPISCPGLLPQAVLEQMYRDKKTTAGTLHLVLPSGIGHCVIRQDIPDSVLLQALIS